MGRGVRRVERRNLTGWMQKGGGEAGPHGKVGESRRGGQVRRNMR